MYEHGYRIGFYDGTKVRWRRGGGKRIERVVGGLHFIGGIRGIFE